MSASSVSVEDRREIAALVSTCLAGIPRGPDGAANASRAIAALANDVQHRWGWDGIFEVACAAYHIVTDGLIHFGGNPFSYIGHGRNAEQIGRDGDTASRVLARFGTALIGADRHAARFEFDGLQPVQSPTTRPSPQMRSFLLQALLAAWSRQAGGPLLMHVDPGTTWPPTCDFCCGRDAEAMFTCHGFDLAFQHPERAMGEIGMTYTDSEFWYACRACRAILEAVGGPNWAELWRRHVGFRPDAQRLPVQALWTAFQASRLHRRAAKLPASRPEPSQRSQR